MHLLNYNLGEALFDVCIEDDQIKSVLTKSHRAILIKNKAIVYQNGEAVEFEVQSNDNDYFDYGDVVVISGIGKVTKYFDGKIGSHTLVVTNQCNSNCIMCPYTSNFRRNAEKPDLNFLKECVDYLPDSTCHIVITGGETTLIGVSFFELMNLIKSRFPSVSCLLLTNGRSFAVETMTDLAVRNFPTMTQFAIPIHASTAEVHDRISQSPNSFDQTLAGIENLLKQGLKVEIRIVVFKQNINEMQEIADLITNQFPQVSVVNFMAAEMCGNAAVNSSDIWIDYNLAFKQCEKAIDILIECGIDVGIYNFPLCSVPSKYHGIYKKSISEYKIRYPEKCENCVKKGLCGGIFSSSIKYSKDDVIPYTGEF